MCRFNTQFSDTQNKKSPKLKSVQMLCEFEYDTI